jgi:hypothetical protein
MLIENTNSKSSLCFDEVWIRIEVLGFETLSEQIIKIKNQQKNKNILD